MTKLLALFLTGALATPMAMAELKIGEAAPSFSVSDVNGKTRTLEEFKGKRVVLEWYNKDCPYVRKHYDSNNMQKLQEELTTKEGYVWLTVVSSVPGKQGHQNATDSKATIAKEKAKSSAWLLDETGAMGKAYHAKTTPHMYVIDEAGVLRYQGAIDSNSSANPNTIAKAENYVRSATQALAKGEPIKNPSTKAYGCSVKY